MGQFANALVLQHSCRSIQDALGDLVGDRNAADRLQGGIPGMAAPNAFRCRNAFEPVDHADADFAKAGSVKQRAPVDQIELTLGIEEASDRVGVLRTAKAVADGRPSIAPKCAPLLPKVYEQRVTCSQQMTFAPRQHQCALLIAPFVNQQAVVDKFVIDEYSDGDPDEFKKTPQQQSEMLNQVMGQGQQASQMAQLPQVGQGTQ